MIDLIEAPAAGVSLDNAQQRELQTLGWGRDVTGVSGTTRISGRPPLSI